MDVTPIVTGLIAVLTCVLGIVVIKSGAKSLSKQDRENLVAWTRIAVAAAEQLYYHLDGPTKKSEVLAFLAKKGFNIDAAEVDAVIESEVLDLHSKLYGWVEGTAELMPGVAIAEDVKPNE